jgi:hypothetical protein
VQSSASLAHVLAALVLVVLVAVPAAAHDGHSALPEGFRAEVVNITDSDGRVALLDGVAFAVAPDGMEVTVTNRGDAVVEVTGEQAGEPFRAPIRAADGAGYLRERFRTLTLGCWDSGTSNSRFLGCLTSMVCTITEQR